MKFEINKNYSTRSICDSECVWTFTILNRTEKTITVNSMGEIKKCKVHLDRNGFEWAMPLGRYSMCPVFTIA